MFDAVSIKVLKLIKSNHLENNIDAVIIKCVVLNIFVINGAHINDTGIKMPSSCVKFNYLPFGTNFDI